MNIHDIFNQFCYDLQNRTAIMTEDNIRYYWFASMLQQDSQLNNYTLEQPYFASPLSITNLSNEELDLFYLNKASNDCFCFEIKFHRSHKQSSSAKTSEAGTVINDLQRLLQISTLIKGTKAHRLLLYVTDDIMHNYYTSMGQPDTDFGQQLNDFYNAQVNDPINIDFTGAPKTFLDSANKSLNNQDLIVFSNLQLILSRDFTCGSASFNGDCHVRLYEI